jgi:hypothetical protein
LAFRRAAFFFAGFAAGFEPRLDARAGFADFFAGFADFFAAARAFGAAFFTAFFAAFFFGALLRAAGFDTCALAPAFFTATLAAGAGLGATALFGAAAIGASTGTPMISMSTSST